MIDGVGFVRHGKEGEGLEVDKEGIGRMKCNDMNNKHWRRGSEVAEE